MTRNRGALVAVAVVLVLALGIGLYLVWPGRTTHKVVALFSSAVGLYPGDDVRVVGVPVGTIDSIEPTASDVKITMSIDDGVQLPADARAIIVAPNLVSARFIQLTPAYDTSTGAPTLADGATIGIDRTGVPVEWDDVKTELTKLADARAAERRAAGTVERVRGPGGQHVRRQRRLVPQQLRELSQTAGRLGDSSTDLFGTIKNLQVLVNALSQSNEQIVQFSNHVASVSQVLADSTQGLTPPWAR